MSVKNDTGFKKQQLGYERVSSAHDRCSDVIDNLLEKQGLAHEPFEIYLRAFKEEGELEVWTRKKGDTEFRLLKNYAICAKSGSLGPKRKQGDKQVPEGFYHVDRFNPMSHYHLSLGVNYPNRSDLRRSDSKQPGGDIFIHGKCVTIGCLPITDAQIEELYLLCVEVKDRGVDHIPITFFPLRMDPKNYSKLISKENPSTEVKELWSVLKSAYDYFNIEKKLPSIRFEPDGSHIIGA
jgi:murein L,D-transpeptidase YafK